MTPGSPFLDVPPANHIAGNRLAFAIWDAFPVSPGHALVVPRRVVPTWWDATPEEHTDLLALVEDVKLLLDERHRPNGYNVGFNSGTAAGQTVDHAHIHVIPRYTGDTPDPRGGVRHVIPELGNYLKDAPVPAPDVAVSDVALLDGVERPLEAELLRCLRDPRYDRIDLVVSFILRSGLRLIDEALQDALERGASIRILTTDYLGITEWAALARLLDLATDHPEEDRFHVQVFRSGATSFHPKAYLFWSSQAEDAHSIVGSSNLSRSGLTEGIEWNLSVASPGRMLEQFTELWLDPRSVPLTAEWLRSYEPASRERRAAPVVELDEPPVQPVAPRPVQQEALHALERTREEGYRAGLVVMATGLGKTWLAAFDTARPRFGRVLFVAHREEILTQSRDVFRQVQPDAELGLFYGGEKRPDARFVFAGVQTLATRLHTFDTTTFDYIVIDEFHHASANSYRKVIDYFEPRFLLGLTATPQRTDGADLLALCNDNLVYDCGLLDGITREELVPFHYWGVPDTVDFEPIPWRNGRFDPEALTRAVETHERAESALNAWQERRGARTLGFCASVSHADFMAQYFADRGIRAAAVHSKPSSAPRHETLDALRDGVLDVIFAVDLFNEGLDIPEIDTVLMLRPTESPVVFLQQLGRGLRTVEGKTHLNVVDFIGNHRSFLLKPRTLLSLGLRAVPSNARLIAALESGEFGLPPGCSVEYELAAIDMLRELGRASKRTGIDEYCRSYYEEEGTRPSAAQAFHAGHDITAARRRHGSWFGLLKHLDLLGPEEAQVLAGTEDVLTGFETEQVNKAHKLVTLKALLHDGTLRSGAPVRRIAEVSRTTILGDPRLLRDSANAEFPDLASASLDSWETYWRKWPIAAWAGELRERPGRWFRIDGDALRPTFTVVEDLGDAFDAMAAEIVEYRLARYLVGKDGGGSSAPTLKVSHANGKPIIFLERERHPDLPEGEATFIAEGREYRGRFMKIALNVAERPGESGNALHALLRGWFGPAAGHPGTNHRVTLEQAGSGRVMRPVADAAQGGAEIIPLFPNFAVACGPRAQTDWADQGAVALPVHPLGDDETFDAAQVFACFARGDSMDGGTDPIRHGDPLLFEWIDSGSARDYDGQRVLVEYADRHGTAASLKRLRRDGPAYVLESDNPAHEPIRGEPSMRIVARLTRRLEQSEVNPLGGRIGEAYKRQDIPPLYGLEYNPGNWQSGHVSLPGHVVLFVTLTKSDSMSYGADYVDHFEGPDAFVWSSQTSTGPEGKKGREILTALDTGIAIHLWARRRKTDVAFTYLGLVVPVSHEGSKPMSVRFRMLSSVDADIWKRLHEGT